MTKLFTDFFIYACKYGMSNLQNTLATAPATILENFIQAVGARIPAGTNCLYGFRISKASALEILADTLPLGEFHLQVLVVEEEG